MVRARDLGFEVHLLELISDWLPSDRQTLVMASGMVGARQGWIEAPYAELPWEGVAVDAIVSPKVDDRRIDVRILPGCASAILRM